jgi:hypothetical protein
VISIDFDLADVLFARQIVASSVIDKYVSKEVSKTTFLQGRRPPSYRGMTKDALVDCVEP